MNKRVKKKMNFWDTNYEIKVRNVSKSQQVLAQIIKTFSKNKYAFDIYMDNIY